MNKECAHPDFYVNRGENEIKKFFKAKEDLEHSIRLIYEKLEGFYKK